MKSGNVQIAMIEIVKRNNGQAKFHCDCVEWSKLINAVHYIEPEINAFHLLNLHVSNYP